MLNLNSKDLRRQISKKHLWPDDDREVNVALGIKGCSLEAEIRLVNCFLLASQKSLYNLFFDTKTIKRLSQNLFLQHRGHRLMCCIREP